MRRAAGVILTALVFVPLVPTPAWGADVHGDDGGDRYVGTGGLILPGGVDSAMRHEVAGCEGCRWRLSPPCVESADGIAFDGQVPCLSVVRGCPEGTLMRSWFQPAGAGWRDIGVVCLQAGRPVTVSDVDQVIAERAVRELPPLSIASQPASGVLAQVPVHFRSGQDAGPVTLTMSILGHDVHITASPAWEWRFGDGTRLETRAPGGVFPQGEVLHAYRHSGRFPVECTARWSAQFTVAGLGPFPVAEPVLQRSAAIVSVGEGRALLAARGMAQ